MKTKDIWDGVKGLLTPIVGIAANAIMPGSGGIVTSMVAKILGCDNTPEALTTAIQGASPDQIIALRKMELDNEVELKELAFKTVKLEVDREIAVTGSVNASIQAEAQSKWWFSAAWRPFWGFVSALAFFVVSVFCCFIAYEAVKTKNFQLLTVVPQLISAMAMLFSIPGAILGVTAWHRGKMQREKITVKNR